MKLTPNPTEIHIHTFKLNPVLHPQIILQHIILCCLLFELCSHLQYESFNCLLYHSLFSTFVDYQHLPDKNAEANTCMLSVFFHIATSSTEEVICSRWYLPSVMSFPAIILSSFQHTEVLATHAVDAWSCSSMDLLLYWVILARYSAVFLASSLHML